MHFNIYIFILLLLLLFLYSFHLINKQFVFEMFSFHFSLEHSHFWLIAKIRRFCKHKYTVVRYVDLLHRGGTVVFWLKAVTTKPLWVHVPIYVLCIFGSCAAHNNAWLKHTIGMGFCKCWLRSIDSYLIEILSSFMEHRYEHYYRIDWIANIFTQNIHTFLI